MRAVVDVQCERLFILRLAQPTRETSKPIIQAEDLLHITTTNLNRIATAGCERDVHEVFVIFIEHMLSGPRLTTETVDIYGI